MYSLAHEFSLGFLASICMKKYKMTNEDEKKNTGKKNRQEKNKDRKMDEGFDA